MLLKLILGESGRFPEPAQLFVQALPQCGWNLLTRYLQSHPKLNLPNPDATARIFTGTLIRYVMTQKMLQCDRIAIALPPWLPKL